MDAEALIDRLDGLALRIERLTISRRDPEWFFIERSEIAYGLRREIARLQRQAEPVFREAREGKSSPAFVPPCESPKENKG